MKLEQVYQLIITFIAGYKQNIKSLHYLLHMATVFIQPHYIILG